VAGEKMGVAKAAGQLSSPDRATRIAAWDAIQQAWRGQEEGAAAILNALAGWRLELNKRRGGRANQEVTQRSLNVASMFPECGLKMA
jgi:oligoendopeptidase F